MEGEEAVGEHWGKGCPEDVLAGELICRVWQGHGSYQPWNRLEWKKKEQKSWWKRNDD